MKSGSLTFFKYQYINYPMIESIRYTKELPDADFLNML